MVTVKQVILTAIHFRGISQVKSETKQLADNLLCSKTYIHSLIKQVEKEQIVIKGA